MLFNQMKQNDLKKNNKLQNIQLKRSLQESQNKMLIDHQNKGIFLINLNTFKGHLLVLNPVKRLKG